VEEMITIPRSEYEWMKREIAELRSIVRQLEDTIALLKGGKNSRTSSTAPSTDLSRSNSHSLRVPSGKKSGGQMGHCGHNLSMSDTPDEIVDHKPLYCEGCHENLQEVVSVSYMRRQVVDIPPVHPVYTEHRSHLKICPCCGFENRGIFPDRLQSPIQYGARVEATAAYMSVYQYLPYHRITQFFNDCFGLPLSEGSIDNFLSNMSQKASSAYETIRQRVQSAPVVGSDETGCRVNGRKHWFHVWQTPSLTFIVSFAHRSFQAISQYFNDGFEHSVYVSDCYAAQLKASAKAHQLCIAHLLRELLNFEKNLRSEWSTKMKDLLMRAWNLKKAMTADDYHHTGQEVASIDTQLDRLLTVDESKFNKKEQALVRRLRKHRTGILTFLYHELVPPDNNASERAIRNVKVKTKVSGQFRNKDGKGADRYAKIRSVIDTTIKNGQDVYAALVCMANCNKIVVVE
jgi:transposase